MSALTQSRQQKSSSYLALHAIRSAMLCHSAVYMTANLSGGHITPTVTIATMITGHITLLKGLAYVLAQLVGSVFGSLLIVRTSPPPLLHRQALMLGEEVQLPLLWHSVMSLLHTAWQHCCEPRLCLCSCVTAVAHCPGCSLQAGLVPGSSIGMGNDGTGCFAPGAGVNNGAPGHHCRSA